MGWGSIAVGRSSTCALQQPCGRGLFSTQHRPDSSFQLQQHRRQEAGFSRRICDSVVCCALFNPPEFDPANLTVSFLSSASESGPNLPAPRRYTLTHSDLTGRLQLSVGSNFNYSQLAGWYSQLFRDEVLAEWVISGTGSAQLHLFCHISGNGSWPAPIPPVLRSKVFQREMPLVLRTIRYGDRRFLDGAPHLLDAQVFVHLSSHIEALDMLVEWGVLGNEQTWKQPPSTWFAYWWKRLLSTSGSSAALPSPPTELLLDKRAGVASSPTVMQALETSQAASCRDDGGATDGAELLPSRPRAHQQVPGNPDASCPDPSDARDDYVSNSQTLRWQQGQDLAVLPHTRRASQPATLCKH